MRLLLDTHALIWWLDGNTSLSMTARGAILDNRDNIYVSAATSWEIATKLRIDKLALPEHLQSSLAEILAEQGFETLSISFEHARLAGSLPGKHGDPFDRILAAQAIFEGLSVVTKDERIREFGSRTLW